MAVKDAVGKYGERVARAALRESGMDILATNWRCRHGEIDIVAFDPITRDVVAIEVKTRRSRRFGHPVEAVTPAKLRRLRTLTALWLREHRPGAAAVRIDVIGVLLERSGAPQVSHIRGVVQ